MPDLLTPESIKGALAWLDTKWVSHAQTAEAALREVQRLQEDKAHLEQQFAEQFERAERLREALKRLYLSHVATRQGVQFVCDSCGVKAEKALEMRHAKSCFYREAQKALEVGNDD